MKENTKEIISYVFVGIMTTLVNYIVYFVLLMIHCHWLIANSISCFFAVKFDFYDKKYVFESQNDIKKELSSFVLLRFLTLIVENGCLYIFITLMHIQPMFSKLLVSFVTILSNYVLCKFKIFKKEGVYNG